MDRMLYIAMEGARQSLQSQAVNSNNLANASTVGFRADLDSFRALQVQGPGFDSRVYATDQGLGIDFRQGDFQSTGRQLDFAIQGEGWIAVQAPDGSEAYTRAGDLRVTETGLLTNGAGHAVLGNGGPIVLPPFEKLEIGEDGSITVLPLGQPATSMAILDRIKLVNPDPGNLEKGPDGLIRTRDGSVAAADASVMLTSGVLESSNVSAVESMTRMIELARQYEMQIKTMNMAKENDTASARLLQMS